MYQHIPDGNTPMNGIKGSDGEELLVNMPLKQWVRDLATHSAREAAKCVIEDHRAECRARNGYTKLAARVETIRDDQTRGEIARWKLVAIMLLGGGIGGGGSQLLAKVIGG